MYTLAHLQALIVMYCSPVLLDILRIDFYLLPKLMVKHLYLFRNGYFAFIQAGCLNRLQYMCQLLYEMHHRICSSLHF